MPSKPTKLTDKQNRFCIEYIIDLNATQAAIRAGYSQKTANRIGSENLTKLVIQQKITKLQANTLEKAEMSAVWVLNQIKDSIVHNGKIVEDKMIDASAFNTSLGMAAKHFKLLTDKVETVNENFNYDMSEADADEILKQAKKEGLL